MTASLYQSGSATDSLVLPGMRVTFAAQSTPRNDPLACSARSTSCRRRHKKKAAALPRPLFSKLKCGLSLKFHDLRGDALPLAVAQHPGVGKTKCPIKCFAVLGGPFF